MEKKYIDYEEYMTDMIKQASTEELILVDHTVCAIRQCISLIEQSETVDEVEIFVSALELNVEIVRKILLPFELAQSVRQEIREGGGDYLTIQEKCIKMGVV